MVRPRYQTPWTEETSYQVGEFYAPETEGGLAYDDPRLGLEWPLPVAVISEKDAQWQPLEAVEAELRRRMTQASGEKRA
jgi:dTDP-4-dehydrorhamnose 3,5-epimerase